MAREVNRRAGIETQKKEKTHTFAISEFFLHTVSYSMADLEQRFEALFLNHSDAIFRHLYFRLGNRERAKELTQEVFMRTWQHLAAGKAISFEKAFLYRVAHNLFINEIRTNTMTNSLESTIEASGNEPADGQLSPSESAEQQELLRMLGRLSEGDREVLVMRYIDGQAVKDIAALLGEKETTISMRIARAMERLRELYHN